MKYVLILALAAMSGCAANDAPRGDVDPALLMLLIGKQQAYQPAPYTTYTHPQQPALTWQQPTRHMNCTSRVIGNQVHTNCF